MKRSAEAARLKGQSAETTEGSLETHDEAESSKASAKTSRPSNRSNETADKAESSQASTKTSEGSTLIRLSLAKHPLRLFDPERVPMKQVIRLSVCSHLSTQRQIQ